MARNSGRLEYVESIRGLACLMLVSFHVVGSAADEGLGLDYLNPLRLLNDGLDNSRMAIFSFISGFVLSAAVLSVDKWRGSIASKARRLLIPMAAVSTIHYVLRGLTVEDQQPFLSIFFTQYAHFWFLQAMFVLTVALLTLSLLLKGKSDRAALILFLTLTPVFLFAERWNPNIMAMYQGLYLAPFFYSGHMFAAFLRRRAEAGRAEFPVWATYVAGVVLAALLTFNMLFILDVIPLDKPWSNLHRLAVGLASAIFFFLLKPNTKFLVWLGSYTYVIYLFHVIFTASTRGLLYKVFPQVDSAYFFVPCVLVGLTAPILLQKLALLNGVTALLFLGIDKRKKSQATQTPAPGGIIGVTADAPPRIATE